jgi:sarcosine oxidase
VRFNTPVVSIAADGAGVAVRTASEVFRAGQVVLAAGAWIPGFLPATHAQRLMVTRQTLHWFAPPAEASAYAPERMPVFIWNDLYGFPIAVRGGGVKIATEALDLAVDPDAVRHEVAEADIELVTPRVRAAFPALGAHMRGATCLYTSTPDFNFWVGAHPLLDNVTVVSACSGHGFKHAAALGEAVVAKVLSAPGIALPVSWTDVSRRG